LKYSKNFIHLVKCAKIYLKSLEFQGWDNIIEMKDRQEVEYNRNTGKLELYIQDGYRSQVLQNLGIEE